MCVFRQTVRKEGDFCQGLLILSFNMFFDAIQKVGSLFKDISKTKKMRVILTILLLCIPGVAPLYSQQNQIQRNQQPADSVLPGILSIDSLFLNLFQRDTLPNDTVGVLHPLEWDNVFHNEKIGFLLHSHREIMIERLGIPGFRVHLYMDSGNRARLNTQHEQAGFEEKYPDQAAYIVYEEPYFKLRVGDFRTRLDARRFLEKIRRDYPAAYIVVDLINYPEMN